mgnify:CR=1 FL=1
MKNNLPYSVLREYNSWENVPRAAAVGAAIMGNVGTASLFGSTFLGGALAFITPQYIVGFLVTSLVTSWAMKALAPKSSLRSSSSSGLLVNAREPAASQDFVYGEVRKGGVITFYESSGDDNTYLHQIIALAGHEVHSVDDIYINDQVATFSGNFVTTAGSGDSEVDWDSKIRIKKYDGSQTTADSDLVSETSATSTFVGNGIAYLYVRYEYGQDVFANGLPLITAKIRGKKVYDPRTASTAYSNNAALCIRDFLTSSYGLSDNSIDDVDLAAAANECDENVALDGGGTEKRYTANGVIKASTPTGSVLEDLVTSCAGTLFWGGGKWKLKAGAYTSPVKTLTLDDLRGPINLSTRVSMRDNFNIVRGTFNDAAQDYITADYPEIKSTAFINQDDGEEVALDLELPFTTSAASAQRLAKLTLFRGREQMTLSADFGLEAMEIEVGDIIAFTNARYGFSAKEFEVVGWKLSASEDAGDLRINLTLRETSQAAFDWNAEETAIISNDSNLPNISAGTAITSLTLSGGGSEVQGDGTVINSLLASWTAADSSFVSYYEVELRQTSSANTTTYTTSETSILLNPIVDNVSYTVRVRSVSITGFRGAYTSATASNGGDVTAPSLPTTITATGGYELITISWTNPANRDLNFVEIYENSSNTTTGANLVGTSSGSYFVRTNLGIDVTKYYFLKAVDFSGNKSGFTSGVSATTAFIDNIAFENGIRQLFLDQGLDIIEPVSSLPAAGDFAGQQVFLTTDGKLYRWTGSAWVLTIAASDAGDITGQITGTQISDNAITAPKILADTITGNKIVANTITGGLLSTSGIITSTAQINDGLIENAKIANGAISRLKVQDGEIIRAKIADAAIDDAKIANLNASKITAGTISADRFIGAGISQVARSGGSSVSIGTGSTFTATLTGCTSGSIIYAIASGSMRSGLNSSLGKLTLAITGGTSMVSFTNNMSTGAWGSTSAVVAVSSNSSSTVTASATFERSSITTGPSYDLNYGIILVEVLQ